MATAVGITAPATEAAALVREAVGVFDDLESLQAAVDELQSSGFSRTDLSTLARFSLVETQLGRGFRGRSSCRAPRSAMPKAC